MRLGSLSFYATSLSGDSFRSLHQKGAILCFEIWNCSSAIQYPNPGPPSPNHPLPGQGSLCWGSFLSCRTHFLFFLCLGE